MAVEVDGLLVKLRGTPGGFAAAAGGLGRIEPILVVPAGTGAAGFGIDGGAPATWVRIEGGDGPWDRAHALMGGGFGADAAGVVAAEPDFAQQWAAPDDRAGKQACVAEAQTDGGGRHDHLTAAIAADPTVADEVGLVAGLPRYETDGMVRAGLTTTTFEVRNVRAARRQGPDGGVSEQILITLAQRRPEPNDGTEIANGFFWHRGGATLVIDPGRGGRPPTVRYSIAKKLGSGDRVARERSFRNDPAGGGLRALYFGDPAVAGNEPFAALHAMED